MFPAVGLSLHGVIATESCAVEHILPEFVLRMFGRHVENVVGFLLGVNANAELALYVARRLRAYIPHPLPRRVMPIRS